MMHHTGSLPFKRHFSLSSFPVWVQNKPAPAKKWKPGNAEKDRLVSEQRLYCFVIGANNYSLHACRETHSLCSPLCKHRNEIKKEKSAQKSKGSAFIVSINYSDALQRCHGLLQKWRDGQPTTALCFKSSCLPTGDEFKFLFDMNYSTSKLLQSGLLSFFYNLLIS